MADRIGKSFLLTIGLAAIMALVFNSFSSRQADAGKEDSGIGRYQISSWAAFSGERVHHSGYYIVDTMTGKVVDKGHEVHGIANDNQPN